MSSNKIDLTWSPVGGLHVSSLYTCTVCIGVWKCSFLRRKEYQRSRRKKPRGNNKHNPRSQDRDETSALNTAPTLLPIPATTMFKLNGQQYSRTNARYQSFRLHSHASVLCVLCVNKSLLLLSWKFLKTPFSLIRVDTWKATFRKPRRHRFRKVALSAVHSCVFFLNAFSKADLRFHPNYKCVEEAKTKKEPFKVTGQVKTTRVDGERFENGFFFLASSNENGCVDGAREMDRLYCSARSLPFHSRQ